MVEEIKDNIVEVKDASFSILDFRILESELKLGKEKEEFNLHVNFIPSGIYDSKNGTYELTFKTIVSKDVESKDICASAVVVGNFKFTSALLFQDIPPYFYRNSIAILYPFVRSYIVTISVQGNNNAIILPVLNLSNLEKPLKENTQVI